MLISYFVGPGKCLIINPEQIPKVSPIPIVKAMAAKTKAPLTNKLSAKTGDNPFLEATIIDPNIPLKNPNINLNVDPDKAYNVKCVDKYFSEVTVATEAKHPSTNPPTGFNKMSLEEDMIIPP